MKAGKATINGVSIADKAKTLEIGKKIVEMRATNTAAAIKARSRTRARRAEQLTTNNYSTGTYTRACRGRPCS